MNFATALKSSLDSEKTLTENGADAYLTSGHALLDINFAVSNMRSASDEDIIRSFMHAYYENKKLAVTWMFFARDVRGGMGERRLFRVCLKWLAVQDPAMVQAIVNLIPEYGRFDDLFELVGTPAENEMFQFISETLAADMNSMANGKPTTLLAKWMPSITTSSPKTVALARIIAARLGKTEREYRKMLSTLRRHIDVTEVKTSSNNWSEIDYSKVSSQANLKYKNAFIKHDAVRRQEFIDKLAKGEAKINSSTAFPHDIYHIYGGFGSYSKEIDATAEAMWKALPDYVKDVDNSNTICVVDGSGSMCQTCGGSNITASDVANALGIYFAERMSDSSPFKNKFITFSSSPQLIDFGKCVSLRDKANLIQSYTECSNTNIERTMMLILETARRNHAKQSDIPNILILSDMHFDSMVNFGSYNTYSYGANGPMTLMENIEKCFNAAGYKMPRITYWNICGGTDRSTTIPVQQSELGVALVSGFSPAIASMVYSLKTDPYEVLVEKLMSERYKPIMEKTSEIYG